MITHRINNHSDRFEKRLRVNANFDPNTPIGECKSTCRNQRSNPIDCVRRVSDFELVLDDPMVVYALTHNHHVMQTDAILESHSRYLVVSPLIAANGYRLGLLFVEHMPFISLNQELLQFIQVTLNHMLMRSIHRQTYRNVASFSRLPISICIRNVHAS